MGKAEVSMVIRTQLNQLQATDPLRDDFYYQVRVCLTLVSSSVSCFFIFSVLSCCDQNAA
jgi:hypothetical protein